MTTRFSPSGPVNADDFRIDAKISPAKPKTWDHPLVRNVPIGHEVIVVDNADGTKTVTVRRALP